MRVTEHFTFAEMGNPPAELHDEVLSLCRGLELVRAHIDLPMTVSSGWRSREHNRRVGGSPTSDHVNGFACDIQVNGMKPADLAFAAVEALDDYGWDQIIVYPTHVHFGFGPRLRRQIWDA